MTDLHENLMISKCQKVNISRTYCKTAVFGLPAGRFFFCGRCPQDPRDPRVRPRVTRRLRQSLRCATHRFLLRFRFASLHFEPLSLCCTSFLASIRISNRTESNLEAHTPTGSADLRFRANTKVDKPLRIRKHTLFQQQIRSSDVTVCQRLC